MGNNLVLRFWTSRTLRDLHVILVVVAVASYIVATISGMDWLYGLGDVVAVLGIAHFFLHTSCHKRYCYISDHLHTYSLPQKKIQRLNAAFLSVLLVLLGVGMALARELYQGTLVAKFKLLLLYLLQKFFGFLFSGGGLDNEHVTQQFNHGLLETLDGLSKQEEKPWDQLMNRIQTVLILLGLVLLLAIILLAIARFIRQMVRGGAGSGKGDTVFETRDKEERLSRKDKKRVSMAERLSPSAKVRRMYRRCIRQKSSRTAAYVWMTPTEIETAAQLPPEEAYQTLHHHYEKARYSEGGCDQADVERLKALL